MFSSTEGSLPTPLSLAILATYATYNSCLLLRHLHMGVNCGAPPRHSLFLTVYSLVVYSLAVSSVAVLAVVS